MHSVATDQVVLCETSSYTQSFDLMHLPGQNAVQNTVALT